MVRINNDYRTLAKTAWSEAREDVEELEDLREHHSEYGNFNKNTFYRELSYCMPQGYNPETFVERTRIQGALEFLKLLPWLNTTFEKWHKALGHEHKKVSQKSNEAVLNFLAEHN